MVVIFSWERLNPHFPLLSEVYKYGGALIVTIVSLGIAWGVVKLQEKIGYQVLR